MVLLVATKKLRYDGKELAPGNEFEASEKDAMILRAIEKAENVVAPAVPEARRGYLPKKPSHTLPPEHPAPEPVDEPPAPVEVAAPSPEPAPTPTPSPEPAPVDPPAPAPVEPDPAPLVTSRYKRRDLQATQE